MSMTYRWARAFGTCLLLVIGASLRAQPAPPPASPMLLRGLASFADDHRTGVPIYAIARVLPPHHIYPRALQTRGEADSLLARFGKDYAVFGPFLTQPGAGPPQRIEWTRMVLEGVEGSTPVRLELDPRVIDAVVFSMSAYDRYFHPYNRAIWGDSLAILMQAQVMRRVAPFACHLKKGLLFTLPCQDVLGWPGGIGPVLIPSPEPPWVPPELTRPR